MLERDPFLRLQARVSAQEYVLKFVVNALNQLAPQADLHTALLSMLENSVAHAQIDSDDPVLRDELRDYVLSYARQIIDNAINTLPTT